MIILAIVIVLLNFAPLYAIDSDNLVTLYQIDNFLYRTGGRPEANAPTLSVGFEKISNICGPAKNSKKIRNIPNYKLFFCDTHYYAVKEEDYKVAQKLDDILKKSQKQGTLKTQDVSPNSRINISSEEKTSVSSSYEKAYTLQGNLSLLPLKKVNDGSSSSNKMALTLKKGASIKLLSQLDESELIVSIPGKNEKYSISKSEFKRALEGRDKILGPILAKPVFQEHNSSTYKFDTSKNNITILPNSVVKISAILDDGKFLVLNLQNKNSLDNTDYVVSKNEYDKSIEGKSILHNPLTITPVIQKADHAYSIKVNAADITLPPNSVVKIKDKIKKNNYQDYYVVNLDQIPGDFVISEDELYTSLLPKSIKETPVTTKPLEEKAYQSVPIIDDEQTNVIKSIYAKAIKSDGSLDTARPSYMRNILANSKITVVALKNNEIIFTKDDKYYSIAYSIAKQAFDFLDPKYIPKDIPQTKIQAQEYKIKYDIPYASMEIKKGQTKIKIDLPKQTVKSSKEKYPVLRSMGDMKLEIPMAPDGPYREIVDNSKKTTKTLDDVSIDQYNFLVETSKKHPGLLEKIQIDHLVKTNYGRCISAAIEHAESLDNYFYCDSEKGKPKLSSKRPNLSKELQAAIAGEFIMIHKCLPLKDLEILPLAFHESRFIPNAVSNTGVVGIGQVTREAAMDVENKMLPNLEKYINKKIPGCKYLMDIKNDPTLRLKTGTSCSQQYNSNNIRLSILYSALYYVLLKQNAIVRVLERYKDSTISQSTLTECVVAYTSLCYNTGSCAVDKVMKHVNSVLPPPEDSLTSFYKDLFERVREEGAYYVPKIYKDLEKMQESANTSCAPQ